jgi:hypothetical protein
MQIIHEDVFGNIAAVSVLFQLSLNNNKFLQELGFGVDDPNFALKLRNNEVMRIKSTANLNLASVC